jgi:type IV pilus assembly protein PilZ
MGFEGDERRQGTRLKVRFDVDYRSDETFLFAAITDISEMGIFIATVTPPPVGETVDLRFNLPEVLRNEMGQGPSVLTLKATVQWVTDGPPNAESPGMGLRFLDPDEVTANRIVELVRTIAYLDSPSQ